MQGTNATPFHGNVAAAPITSRTNIPVNARLKEIGGDALQVKKWASNLASDQEMHLPPPFENVILQHRYPISKLNELTDSELKIAIDCYRHYMLQYRDGFTEKSTSRRDRAAPVAASVGDSDATSKFGGKRSIQEFDGESMVSGVLIERGTGESGCKPRLGVGSDESQHGEIDEVYDLISLDSLPPKRRLALLNSNFIDPSKFTHAQLTTMLSNESLLSPPPCVSNTRFTCLSPNHFHMFSMDTHNQRKKDGTQLLFKNTHTSTAILEVAVGLARKAMQQGDREHPKMPTTMGISNFQLALAYLAMTNTPNGRPQMQLLNHAIGGIAPEQPIKVLQDHEYVVLFITFDKREDPNHYPLAEVTKNYMLKWSMPGTLKIMSCTGTPNSYVKEINDFCNEGTNGKIPQIVTELDSNCAAMLLCCSYISVRWEREGERLPIGDFWPHPGSLAVSEQAQITPLLQQQRYFAYKDLYHETWTDSNTNVTWLKLDCQGDKRFMLYGLPKPDDNDPTESLYASMKEISLPKFQPCEFSMVQLPCVKVATNKLDGKELLQELNVSDIFDTEGSMPMVFWSPTCASNVSVDCISHASCIEMNDKGAEACAATSVTFK